MYIDERWKRVGHRIGEWLELSGMTQEQLADKVPCSQAYVSQIIHGTRTISKPATLHAFARALQVSVTDLTGQPVPARDSADRDTYSGADAVSAALFMPEDAVALPSLDELRADAGAVLGDWMRVDYTALGRRLPRLLNASQVMWEQRGGEEALDLILRACVAGSLAYRPVGWPTLALALAQRATEAAHRLGDPAAEGAAAYVTAQCALAAGKAERSLTLVEQAAQTVDASSGADARTWSTMLHLQAGLSAATLSQTQAAERHFDAAAEYAGEPVAFGSWDPMEPTPDNVLVWRADAAMQNGTSDPEHIDPDRTLQLAQRVDVTRLRTPQRRGRLHMRKGCALFYLGDHPGAIRELLQADEESASQVRNRPEIRDIVLRIGQDVPVRGTGSDQMRELALKVGVLPNLELV